MAYVSVDVHVDDIINELEDDELIEELEQRGYTVSKDESVEHNFDKEDWQHLIEMLDKQPVTWYTRRVRDKLMEACHG